MNISQAREGRETDSERGEGDCTHGPELHAWWSPCAVPVNGDLSEREREREMEQEEKRKAEGGSQEGD